MTFARKYTAALLAATILAGLVSIIQGAPARASGCSHLVVDAPTFVPTVVSERRRYRVGETADLTAAVSRQAGPDNPGANVLVVLVVHVKDESITAYGKTDATGRLDVSIDIPKNMPTGRAHVHVRTWRDQITTACATVREVGDATAWKLFSIKAL